MDTFQDINCIELLSTSTYCDAHWNKEKTKSNEEILKQISCGIIPE